MSTAPYMGEEFQTSAAPYSSAACPPLSRSRFRLSIGERTMVPARRIAPPLTPTLMGAKPETTTSMWRAQKTCKENLTLFPVFFRRPLHQTGVYRKEAFHLVAVEVADCRKICLDDMNLTLQARFRKLTAQNLEYTASSISLRYSSRPAYRPR
jgi:hypothetical protein